MQVTIKLRTLIGILCIAAAAYVGIAQPTIDIPLPWVVDGGGKAPIAEPGFRVLIVEETSLRPILPKGQQEILFATKAGSVRDYCERKCVQVGGEPEFRLWDKDNKMDQEKSSIWKAAFARPRTELPWLLVSNGKKGYEGPLPKTAAETLSLLKKFGGE